MGPRGAEANASKAHWTQFPSCTGVIIGTFWLTRIAGTGCPIGGLAIIMYTQLMDCLTYANRSKQIWIPWTKSPLGIRIQPAPRPPKPKSPELLDSGGRWHSAGKHLKGGHGHIAASFPCSPPGRIEITLRNARRKTSHPSRDQQVPFLNSC